MTCDLLFLRLPRCASASIRTFCDAYHIDYVDAVNYGFWGQTGGRSILKRFKYFFGPQSLSRRIFIEYGGDKYAEKFKFTSVRNPYARAMSIWRHDSFSSILTFTEFCECLNSNRFPSRCAKWHASVCADHIFTKGELRLIMSWKYPWPLNHLGFQWSN